MKISDKASDLIDKFSIAAEKAALSSENSTLIGYCAAREDLEHYIAKLEETGEALAISAQIVTDILPLEIASGYYIAELVYKIHDWVNITRKEREK